MSQYRAYAEGELPNLELRSTREEALQDAIIRLQEEHDADLPTIIIEKVRPAVLSDFFELRDTFGDLRERMSEAIGNDDALSDPVKLDALVEAAEGQVKSVLDMAAEHAGLRIDGLIVLHGERFNVEAGD